MMLNLPARLRSLAMVVGLLLGATPFAVHAQDATPGAGGGATGPQVVASGLINPRGFTWGQDGTLYVALAGNGGLTSNPEPPAAAESAPAPNATPDLVADTADVLAADQSGAVVQIVAGCPVDFAAGFPSYNFLPLNWADGVIDVAFLDGILYALVDGGGEVALHPDEPNGVYRILDDGSSELVADLSAWFRANPVAEPTHDISPDGQPYAMIAGDGRLWITESNHEQLLTVTPDGTITRIVDLSPEAVLDVTVPTGVVLAPDGGVYIGLLTELPFPDGAAKVIQVDADGTITDVWTGLTAITDIGVGPDGSLYASELATGNTDTEPFYHPHTGNIVRQTGPDSSQEIATGLDYPVHLGFGPDGMLYVASPAFGANGGQGTILRLDPEAASVPLNDVALTATCSEG
jgi:hypothetical protein